MKVKTTRFGEVDVADDAVWNFPEGILGFAAVRMYFILNNPKGGPFQWLQAVDPPALAFVVCDPALLRPDYRVTVRKEDLASIELEKAEDGFVMVIVTVPKNPMEMTANLQGPIVFNPKRRLAKQIVLNDAAWPTRHRVFPEAAAQGAGAGTREGGGA